MLNKFVHVLFCVNFAGEHRAVTHAWLMLQTVLAISREVPPKKIVLQEITPPVKENKDLKFPFSVF